MKRDVFHAIEDPIRRDIIQMVSNEPMTVNQVAEKFEISRPAISKHIKILCECGVIEMNQSGRERFCMIRPKNLLPAFMWLEQYRKLWEERIDSFEDYLMKLQSENKNKDNG